MEIKPYVFDLEISPRKYLSTFPNDSPSGSYGYYYKFVNDKFIVMQCYDQFRHMKSLNSSIVFKLYEITDNMKLIKSLTFKTRNTTVPYVNNFFFESYTPDIYEMFIRFNNRATYVFKSNGFIISFIC